MEWAKRKAWVFDMDGTLTHAVHDFTAIKRQLGLPSDRPILESLQELTRAEAEPIEKELAEIEYEIAGQAKPSPGCVALLSRLTEAGHHLGILTRNTRRNAMRTLTVSGLKPFFEDHVILGRDEAAPKPDPAGILHLLDQWGVTRDDAVMLGDAIFDLQAGQAAGVLTVYVDHDGTFEHRQWADVCVRTPSEIEQSWRQAVTTGQSA